MEEVSCIEPSHSVRVPCIRLSKCYKTFLLINIVRALFAFLVKVIWGPNY
jgi:hypothetical protein